MKIAASLALGLLFMSAPAQVNAQQQCTVQDTSPRRTIVNGYMRYVGEEVGTPGSVIHLGSLALRVTKNGLGVEEEVLNDMHARRQNGGQITKSIEFDLKSPGLYENGIPQSLTIYEGQSSSEILKYNICGAEVSISVTEPPTVVA